MDQGFPSWNDVAVVIFMRMAFQILFDANAKANDDIIDIYFGRIKTNSGIFN